MSLNVLTQGGGAGGEFASIFITGLSETDTVTAVKDGKTVKGKWTQKPNPASKVPDGYTQLEYIESTGTQYIDTGVSGGANAAYEISFNPLTGYQAYEMYFAGADHPHYFPAIFRNYNTNSIMFEWGNTSVTIENTLNTDHIVSVKEDGSVLCDGVSVGLNNGFAGRGWGNGTWWVFNSHAENQLYSTMRLYSLKMWTDGVCDRDFVPVKRNSDNVYGLYDLVSNTFFGNAGTGEFIAGEEVDIPKYVYGHEIAPIKEYGMWTVTATDGTNTKTQDVLVDAATEYNIAMHYFFYTEFDEKEDKWVEEGGTFNYGDGLWVPYGGQKGTINAVGSDYYKYLTIPYTLKNKWTVSFSTYVYTSANAGMGGARIQLLDANGNVLVSVSRNDGWAGDANQTHEAVVGGTALYSSGAVSNLNGGTLDHKVVYTGDSVKYYENNVLKGVVDADLPDVASVRIAFVAYTNTANYPIANIKIGYLRLDTVVDEELWLYRSGDECVNVTGGWVTQGLGLQVEYNVPQAPILTKNATNMVLSRTSATAYACGIILPQNKIDFTKYKTINIVVDFAGLASNDNCLHRGYFIKDKLGSVCNDGTMWYELGNASSAGANKTLTGDISARAGLFVPYFSIYSKGSLTIHKIWLE